MIHFDHLPESCRSNVFAHEDALQKYYDPDFCPPTPLVELPASLNPYRGDAVRIYAKLHSSLPAANIKSLPALNMLREARLGQQRISRKTSAGQYRRIVEYSSGSTVISLAILGKIFGLESVSAYVSNKTSAAKLKLMQFFGLDLHLFGGPSQPQPDDDRGGIMAARKKAEEDCGTLNPNQYENENNYLAHMRWTAPQILRQLPDVDVVVAGMGTAGTMTGLGLGMKLMKPVVIRVGVTTAPKDRVPGPRSEALLAPVTFPWRDAIDNMQWVGSLEAYSLSMQLCRIGLLAGPSSGLSLQGLYQFLERAKVSGQLASLRQSIPKGEINCVFLCCDGPFQYIDEYMSKLPPASFGRIFNQELLDVDLHRYEDSWELTKHQMLLQMYPSHVSTASPPSVSSAGSSPPFSEAELNGPIVVDLRRYEDTRKAPWPLASVALINVPLESLMAGSTCPFKDPTQLRTQWLELHSLFGFKSKGTVLDDALSKWSETGKKEVLVLCYTGNTSRIACSILRHRGIKAWSAKGGLDAWACEALL